MDGVEVSGWFERALVRSAPLPLGDKMTPFERKR